MIIKKRLKRVFTAVLSGILYASVAHAEVVKTTADLKPGSRIVAFIERKDNIQSLGEIGRIWDRRLGIHQECKSEKKVYLDSFSIIKQVTLPEGQNFPTEGMWSYRFNYERCGEKKTYNAILEIKPDGKLRLTPHVPGNSKASITLMIDASKSAYPIAIVKLKKEHNLSQCTEGIQLINALITQSPSDLPQGGWREDWMFLGCGQHTISLPVDFFPDKAGTTFVVGR